MGYRIQYQPELEHKYPTQERKSKNVMVITTVILLCITFFSACILNENQWLKELIWPDSVAIEALGSMAEQVSAGHSMKEAFAEFCIEIIKNGS